MMLGIILWMHITLGGNSSIVQDRFETVAACEEFVTNFRHEIGSNWGVSYKSHICKPSA